MGKKEYLTSKKLQRRLKYICAKFGRIQDYEDVYQSYCVHILEGKGEKQTLDQFFIDYSRKNKWCARDLPAPLFTEFEDYKCNMHPVIELKEIDRISSLLSGTEKSIFKMFFKFDLLIKEIADVFDVCPSRISQIINESISRVKEREQLHIA